jgi:hypothetical protein
MEPDHDRRRRDGLARKIDVGKARHAPGMAVYLVFDDSNSHAAVYHIVLF